MPLIEAGAPAGSLVSPRTAREFGLEANGANGWEMPEALAMAGGDLPAADALAALGTGLYVGNLWYLNYSDRPACRITGMTRFATFWVERGRIVAPIDVLRFDDTLARVLGSSLEALTRETELMLSTDTYRQRSLASMRLPGRCCPSSRSRSDVHPLTARRAAPRRALDPPSTRRRRGSLPAAADAARPARRRRASPSGSTRAAAACTPRAGCGRSRRNWRSRRSRRRSSP